MTDTTAAIDRWHRYDERKLAWQAWQDARTTHGAGSPEAERAERAMRLLDLPTWRAQ